MDEPLEDSFQWRGWAVWGSPSIPPPRRPPAMKPKQLLGRKSRALKPEGSAVCSRMECRVNNVWIQTLPLSLSQDPILSDPGFESL